MFTARVPKIALESILTPATSERIKEGVDVALPVLISPATDSLLPSATGIGSVAEELLAGESAHCLPGPKFYTKKRRVQVHTVCVLLLYRYGSEMYVSNVAEITNIAYIENIEQESAHTTHTYILFDHVG